MPWPDLEILAKWTLPTTELDSLRLPSNLEVWRLAC
jgi:hypothetical protein